MTNNSKPSFAFLVVTYNHQEYILEHLESIKYLVQTYGAGWDIDLMISDDCSRDKTVELVNRWLAINAGLFRYIKAIYNSKNLGTCASLNNMLSQVVAERCKHTAGDDVYSFENIFELTKYNLDEVMVSGQVLYLLGDQLKTNYITNFLVAASQVIYQQDSLLHRFKHFSYNNAPNILYATESLLNPKVQSYLKAFDVIDDWALQIAIAREFPSRRFRLIENVLVYYRRTLGSTYIVANQRFLLDKNRLYIDLINKESCLIERIRLANRKYCLNVKNFWVKRILNLDSYFFLLSIVMRLPIILGLTTKINFKINLNLNEHRYHYLKIRLLANSFLLNHFD